MQWFGPRGAGWYRKGSVPKREEGREQREERREKREGRMNRVDVSTHGIEDKHDQDEKVE